MTEDPHPENTGTRRTSVAVDVRMRVSTIGAYLVSARARQQGTRWVGIYSLRKFEGGLTMSAVFAEDIFTEETYGSRLEAEDAAVEAGEALAHDTIARRKR